MVGLEPIKDLVSMIVWTGAVQGERPVSAIIAAPPGGGKTSLLEAVNCSLAPFVTDLTSREISTILSNHRDATHILLGDLMAVFRRRKSTVSGTINMLSCLTGDNINIDTFTGKRLENAPRIGLITAIPTEDLEHNKDVMEHLGQGGFASRFLFLRYWYSPKTLARIHEFIRRDEYTRITRDVFKITKERLPIIIDDELSLEIERLSFKMRPANDRMGTRIHLHLRALLKARARRAGRIGANREDYEVVSAYAGFLTEEGMGL